MHINISVIHTREEVFSIGAVAYDSRPRLLYTYISKVLPEVEKQLKAISAIYENTAAGKSCWQEPYAAIRNSPYMQCASIFALHPKVDLKSAVAFIAALHAISIYLDNLCSMTGLVDKAVRMMYQAMLDAADPGRTPCNYYLHYPYQYDGTYLSSLVEDCRLQVKTLPAYDLVIDRVKKYIQMYTDLQVQKNYPGKVREESLRTWSGYYTHQHPGISCWEFSASADSITGVCAMVASAFDDRLTPAEVEAIDDAYSPWICGLHKLLACFVDARDDKPTDFLNYTVFYKNLKQCEERLVFFTERAVESCIGLRYAEFHLTMIRGLLAVYLSDSKAFFGLYGLASRNLLAKSPPKTRLYWNTCRLLRAASRL